MMHRLLDRVTGLARRLEVTRGCKVRIDATVVPTAIHHPRIARRWRIRWAVVHKVIGTSRSALSQSRAARSPSGGAGCVAAASAHNRYPCEWSTDVVEQHVTPAIRWSGCTWPRVVQQADERILISFKRSPSPDFHQPARCLTVLGCVFRAWGRHPGGRGPCRSPWWPAQPSA